MGARIADGLTQFSGSWAFLGLHALWWTVWLLLPVEPFPFGLLTMVLSLEAIVLGTLILMSQNRAADRDHAALALDRERHKHIEVIAERIETLEQSQFTILHHLERLSAPHQATQPAPTPRRRRSADHGSPNQ
jgi:uncharacterized membrane protein